MNNEDLVFVKPTTYMNNSGIAVVQAKERYGAENGNIIVVCDDFNIPEGALRLRKSGSSGGHNGLSSVIYSLDTEEFPRLRIGIGNDRQNDEGDIDFVLSEFSDKKALEDMIEKGSDAIFSICMKGIDRTMNEINRKPVEKENLNNQ